jgi:uncharacterized protein (DUF1015 family)
LFSNQPLESLDTQILYETAFTTLAIKDLRDDERIEYVSGKQSILELKQIIDEGEFEGLFFSIQHQ